jgi:hypothetical protein
LKKNVAGLEAGTGRGRILALGDGFQIRSRAG